MNRAQRRRTGKDKKNKDLKIRQLAAHIQSLRDQGILAKPKPSIFQKIKRLFKKSA